MLYLITSTVFVIWLAYLFYKKQIFIHTFIVIYSLILVISDMFDVTTFWIFGLYEFKPSLMQYPQDGFLGLALANSIIWPIYTAIFYCYVKRGNRWFYSFLFSLLLTMVEIVHVKFGSFVYHGWSTFYSFIIYFTFFRTFAQFSNRFGYKPPVPYWIRFFTFVYLNEVPGAYLGGGVFKLFQWRSYLILNEAADDRLIAVGTMVIMGIIASIIAVKLKKSRLRKITFLIIGMTFLVISLTGLATGWLIYHHWNLFLATIRFSILSAGLIWYDQWERKYTENLYGLRVL